MATTNKALRKHAARESGVARAYLYWSYLHSMEDARNRDDMATYYADRALFVALFEDMNNRLVEAEAAL